MGRLKKHNAVKSGELQSGLIRFTFIAQAELILELKSLAAEKELPVKDLMHDILTRYIKRAKPKNVGNNSDRPESWNIGKLKSFLETRSDDK